MLISSSVPQPVDGPEAHGHRGGLRAYPHLHRGRGGGGRRGQRHGGDADPLRHWQGEGARGTCYTIICLNAFLAHFLFILTLSHLPPVCLFLLAFFIFSLSSPAHPFGASSLPSLIYRFLALKFSAASIWLKFYEELYS